MLDFKNISRWKLVVSQIIFALLGYVFFTLFQNVKASHTPFTVSELETVDILLLSFLTLAVYSCWGTVLSLTPIHFLKK